MTATTILITGTTAGLGLGAATASLDAGHRVIAHARSEERVDALAPLLDRGAQYIVGDLADATQVADCARHAAALAPIDAVIHNAGVLDGPTLCETNVIAPYLLTALLPDVSRHVYLSSSMHSGGRARLDPIRDPSAAITYSDSKLLVTALCFAISRRRPDVLANAVDPGWVPTRMGGSSAPDSLKAGHETQVWLATSDDEDARVTGRYWHHQRVRDAVSQTQDGAFQDALLDALAERTGVPPTGA